MSDRKTSGVYSLTDDNKYFLAGEMSSFKLFEFPGVYQNLLVAMNYITASSEPIINQYLSEGVNILIDSGVHGLNELNKKARNVSELEAVSTRPEDVVGFDALFKQYVEFVTRYQHRVWGVIEIDQGGAVNKRRIRHMLEEEYGIKPIPVYHPVVDDFEYFDELAENYDRICVGNVAFQTIGLREKILAMIDARRKKYEPLWIHALGLTPDIYAYSFNIQSCDSSSWASGLRWGRIDAVAGAERLGELPGGFIYVINNSANYKNCANFVTYEARMIGLNWAASKREGVR